MPNLNPLDPSDPQQDKAANDAHDRKYGWRKEFPREYTNKARNPEYQAACPHSWLEACKDHHEAHQKIWDWHNRNQEPVLQLVTENRNISANPLYENR